MAEPTGPRLPADDILPGQIVEDDNGVMHVVPAERLLDALHDAPDPATETGLGVENLENDLPCTDVPPEDPDDSVP